MGVVRGRRAWKGVEGRGKRAPDGDDLSCGERDAVHLGYEDGSHCFVEGSAVHVNGGSYGQHEAGDPFVYSQVLLQTPERDRKSCSAVLVVVVF